MLTLANEGGAPRVDVLVDGFTLAVAAARATIEGDATPRRAAEEPAARLEPKEPAQYDFRLSVAASGCGNGSKPATERPRRGRHRRR